MTFEEARTLAVRRLATHQLMQRYRVDLPRESRREIEVGLTAKVAQGGKA